MGNESDADALHDNLTELRTAIVAAAVIVNVTVILTCPFVRVQYDMAFDSIIHYCRLI